MEAALSLLALALSVLACVGASRALTLSVPASVRAKADEALAVAQEVAADWRAERVHQERWYEAAEGVLESVERKRRRAAGAASRAAGNGNGEAEPAQPQAPPSFADTYAALQREAQEQGVL